MSDMQKQALNILSMALQNVERRDDYQFTAEMEKLIQEAEETRLDFMTLHRGRSFMSLFLGLSSIMIGAGGFGWFLLMEADIVKAVISMAAAVILPVILHFWSEKPLKEYVNDYKTGFMPKMAQALGGLKFYPRRGISAQIIAATGVIPAYKNYQAEDCFMGLYKGVKVMFSEARLYGNKKGRTVFDGVFVLLEIPHDIIEGHTVITADNDMVKKYADSRWSKLSPVNISVKDPKWGRFKVFSDKPEAASLLVGEKLLKELSEASDVFDEAPLTTVLFRGKYVFMMIPYDKDMFEASNVYVPVTTKDHALSCKKEIERILEVIDVFELYRAGEGSEAFVT